MTNLNLIEILTSRLGGDIPSALIDFWETKTRLENDESEIYSVEDAIERNETFEVAEFCPGFVVIGNDSSSRVALLKLGNQSDEVFLNYIGSLRESDMQSTGFSLTEWIQNGYPFENEESEPEISAVTPVYIRLDAEPNGGLKELVKIRKILNLEISLSELKNLPKKTPIQLCKMSYIRALRAVSSINDPQQIASIWSVEEKPKQLPLHNPFD